MENLDIFIDFIENEYYVLTIGCSYILCKITSNPKLVKNRITLQFIVLVDCKVRKLYYSVRFVFIHCLRKPEQLNGILPATTVQFSY